MLNRFPLHAALERIFRGMGIAAIFIVYGFLAITLASFHGEEHDQRIGHDKEFRNGRRIVQTPFSPRRKRTPRPNAKSEEYATRTGYDKEFINNRRIGRKPSSPKRKRTPRPNNNQPANMNGELIGVTIWRLRPATASDPKNVPRELTPEGEAVLESTQAHTEFCEGDRVRLSVEYPRPGRYYLYLIDREEYGDGTLSEPKLIYPNSTTPPQGNVLTPGELRYIPAYNDPPPYFRLRRNPKRKDQVSERITLIISREPLTFSGCSLVSSCTLSPEQVAQWEKEWGGDTPPKPYEARGGAGRVMTQVEQPDGAGKKDLVRDDPLPQTVYYVAVKPTGKVALAVPLKIAQRCNRH